MCQYFIPFCGVNNIPLYGQTTFCLSILFVGGHFDCVYLLVAVSQLYSYYGVDTMEPRPCDSRASSWLYTKELVQTLPSWIKKKKSSRRIVEMKKTK